MFSWCRSNHVLERWGLAKDVGRLSPQSTWSWQDSCHWALATAAKPPCNLASCQEPRSQEQLRSLTISQRSLTTPGALTAPIWESGLLSQADQFLCTSRSSTTDHVSCRHSSVRRSWVGPAWTKRPSLEKWIQWERRHLKKHQLSGKPCSWTSGEQFPDKGREKDDAN